MNTATATTPVAAVSIASMDGMQIVRLGAMHGEFVRSRQRAIVDFEQSLEEADIGGAGQAVQHGGGEARQLGSAEEGEQAVSGELLALGHVDARER